MESVDQSQIETFCGNCECRTAPDRACEDGLFKQMERVRRGDCVKAVIDGIRGFVTEDGFTPLGEAKKSAFLAEAE